MSSSEEDRGASNKGDDLSGSTGEDVVTLFLTPVDLSCEPSHKKRILEKSKGNYVQSILLINNRNSF